MTTVDPATAPTATPATSPATARPVTLRARRTRAGWALTGLVGVFLLVDAVLHLLDVPVVQEASAVLGLPPGSAVLIGLVELACLVVHLVPRTAVLGAVLLTGYLGGAVSAQLRIEAPLLSTLLFPVYVGVLVWVGLWLRDTRVAAALAPPRR